jgi:hypothetical protein
MFCPKCGTKRNGGSAFCGSCGNQFPNTAHTIGTGVPCAQNNQTQSSPRYDASYAPYRTSNTVARRAEQGQRGLNKKVLAIGGILVVALIVILMATSGGSKSGLLGTWEDRDGNEWVFSDSSVWIIHNRRDGSSSYVQDVSEGTYFTIDSEIRFYGLNRMGDVNHYTIDGNNLFLGPMALTRVSSNQSPTPFNTRGLTGTWDGQVLRFDDNDYVETITFSGNSFTTTSYRRIEVAVRQIQNDSHDPHAFLPVMDIPEAVFEGSSPLSMRELQTEIERNDAAFVQVYTQQGMYEERDYEIVKITGRGTFSVAGNEIEFTLSDGSTITRKFFFSTEDVLRIGHSVVTKGDAKR